MRLRRIKSGDRLHLEEFLETELAPLAAIARLLVAAERRGAVIRHALQVDVAGADTAADPARALDRIAGDVTGEPKGRVVGDPDRILLVLGTQDRQHGAEDLLARDRHVVGNVGEDGWTDVEALVHAFRQTRSAGNQRRTFLD